MPDSLNQLNKLMEKGCAFLGTRYAIMGGAMSWVSERNLVSAISNAGGFGVIACGSMSPDLLDQELKATKAMTNKPFGVNLITMHPALNDLVEVCIQNAMGHVVLAGGLPPRTAIETLKEAGIKVICFAPALSIAKRLVRSGVDALVIEGHEAGGHIGPVATSVLVQEILPEMSQVPVFVAGGIGRGDCIVSYLKMGAAGCQLGTRFVCAHESLAHENFKKAFIRASAKDAVVSVQYDKRFPVIPVRALANEGMDRFLQAQKDIVTQVDAGKLDLKEAQLQIEHFWAGALRRAVIEGDIATGSLMAGQSVGMVTSEESLEHIMQTLIQQACQALQQESMSH